MSLLLKIWREGGEREEMEGGTTDSKPGGLMKKIGLEKKKCFVVAEWGFRMG